MGDTLLSSRAGLISRCAGLRAHPENEIEHKMTQAVRSFGASDFRLAACDRSPASSQESWKRSAPPGIAMPMISDQTRHRAAHMKISRSAAIMNGKFESNSNDYDESNLNRLHTVHDGLTSPTASVRSSSANRARPATSAKDQHGVARMPSARRLVLTSMPRVLAVFLIAMSYAALELSSSTGSATVGKGCAARSWRWTAGLRSMVRLSSSGRL